MAGARDDDDATEDGARVTYFRIGDQELAVLSFPAPSATLLDGLTPAEREVLEGVIDGQSNAAISEARGTSLRTVANQVASILRKLEVSSRAELTAKLFGLDDADEPDRGR